MTRGKARQLRSLIENLAVTLDDETALTGPELFPMWKPETDYALGERVQHMSTLYKCVQTHTSQENWTPAATPALWVRVSLDEYPEWVQPTGTHDAYNTGDKVTYQGERYVCDVDGNTWAPDVYGWTKL